MQKGLSLYAVEIESDQEYEVEPDVPSAAPVSVAPRPAASRSGQAVVEDSLVSAKEQLSEALEGLVDVLRSPDLVSTIGEVDRANLAKYLTIVKLKIENTIAVVRTGDTES